jgi:hypothetical protein
MAGGGHAQFASSHQRNAYSMTSCTFNEVITLGILENVRPASSRDPWDRLRISVPDVSAAMANTGERRASS